MSAALKLLQATVVELTERALLSGGSKNVALGVIVGVMSLNAAATPSDVAAIKSPTEVSAAVVAQSDGKLNAIQVALCANAQKNPAKQAEDLAIDKLEPAQRAMFTLGVGASAVHKAMWSLLVDVVEMNSAIYSFDPKELASDVQETAQKGIALNVSEGELVFKRTAAVFYSRLVSNAEKAIRKVSVEDPSFDAESAKIVIDFVKNRPELAAQMDLASKFSFRDGKPYEPGLWSANLDSIYMASIKVDSTQYNATVGAILSEMRENVELVDEALASLNANSERMVSR